MQATRFDKKKKQDVQIECPAIVQQRNKHRGGVDLLDSFLWRYKNKMRSKKWYFRLFYHMLDMSIVNSWILFQKVHGRILQLKDFRAQVAECLCKVDQSRAVKRGRPSNWTQKKNWKIKKIMYIQLVFQRKIFVLIGTTIGLNGEVTVNAAKCPAVLQNPKYITTLW